MLSLQSPLYLIIPGIGESRTRFLMRVVLGLGGVNSIQALGLDQAVNKSTGKPGEKSLGLIVRRRLAILLNMLLVGAGSLVRRRGSDQLVGELGLVGLRRVGRVVACSFLGIV